jgi:hypothetical protein
MTRVFGLRLQPGAFFFLQQNAERAVETATAEEIDKGCLWRFLIDDSLKLFGKAFAKTAPALPPLPQPRRRLSFSEEAITNKPPNTKFKVLPLAVRRAMEADDIGHLQHERPALEVFHEFIERVDYRIAGLLCQVGVDLSSPRAVVSEILLNDAEVDAHLQQVCRVRMPQRMNMGTFGNAGAFDGVFEGLLQTVGADRRDRSRLELAHPPLGGGKHPGQGAMRLPEFTE